MCHQNEETLHNPLMPALASMMATTFQAITHQPLELESCSNPLRVEEVF